MAIDIVEKCQVTPSPGAVAEQLLPLLHFDMIWLRMHLMQNLFFYNFPCSESHFFETIVPKLKKSLSLTLKHFPPLAGHIIFPLTNSGMPVSHYVVGDSFPLTIARSKADLIPLTGNHARDSDQFHDFIPDLQPATYSPDSIKFSVAAIQVTLFSDQGICIGFTNHHTIADGLSVIGFLHTWASITKLKGDTHLLALAEKYLPFYDRSVVPHADMLAAELWNNVRTRIPEVSLTTPLPTNKSRATFVLSEAETLKLKKRVPTRVSSFVIVCAYVWTCVAKLAAAIGEEVADDEREYLACGADSRGRLIPPLLETYFGNCLELVLAGTTHGGLKGSDGIVVAAHAIEEAIGKTFGNDKKSLDGSANLNLMGKRVLGVAGSPRFDLYGADYGWGRPKKYEAIQIDGDGSVSLCKSRESEGGVEISLSMMNVKMDAFAAIFNHGLNEAKENILD